LPLHYSERQRIVAAVHDDVLRKMHAAIAEDHEADWRALLDVTALEPAGHG
jgi:hypothetical protein